ncbi:hypothetical protein O181_043082 [Austropuccinia psidii MF-1]|uniref:Uncharacterized protein n=1 Tax=Austropuccinia psidii MF-1 TaxID=1389203 RepID=A0A9Q3HGG6_9BASI|nr:hypothetical protein [Austropuccinia psidii MF-1]
MVPNYISHQSSASPPQPSSRRFQIKLIKITPRNFNHPILYSSNFNQSFYFQTCLGFTSEAITHSSAQKFSNGHLPKPTTRYSTQETWNRHLEALEKRLLALILERTVDK